MLAVIEWDKIGQLLWAAPLAALMLVGLAWLGVRRVRAAIPAEAPA